jgi:2-phospho-L-lactate guanylyltransferase
VIVSGEPHVRDLVSGDHVVLIDDPSEKGQSHAAATGIARAAALGFERALLVPADCPLLDPAEMDRLVADAHDRGDDVVIVPDRHERGTNALLIDPSGPFTPQFGEESLSRHVEQARRRGLRHSVVPSPSLGLDLDTADDLDQLMAVLARSHGRAPRTEGVLRQLERSRQRPQVAA